MQTFLSDYPQLLTEWDYIKNADLDPKTLRHRTNGSGCPACAAFAGARDRVVRHISLAGSLATNNPQLAAEWHPTKNGDITPADVTALSNKKAWWMCARGHEWQTSIANRNDKASKCPYCSGRAVILGRK